MLVVWIFRRKPKSREKKKLLDIMSRGWNINRIVVGNWTDRAVFREVERKQQGRKQSIARKNVGSKNSFKKKLLDTMPTIL